MLFGINIFGFDTIALIYYNTDKFYHC